MKYFSIASDALILYDIITLSLLSTSTYVIEMKIDCSGQVCPAQTERQKLIP